MWPLLWLGPVLNVVPNVELGSIRSVIAKFLRLTNKLFVFNPTLDQRTLKKSIHVALPKVGWRALLSPSLRPSYVMLLLVSRGHPVPVSSIPPTTLYVRDGECFRTTLQVRH